jgi:hypothetical protein
MATEEEIVFEDDYNYLAVSKAKGLRRDGTVCVLEIGKGGEAPEDRAPVLFFVSADGARDLISALSESLEEK